MESAGRPSRRWRVSLRSKGILVLAMPLAGLLAAVSAVYWVDSGLQAADRELDRAFDIRAALMDLRDSLVSAQAGLAHYGATSEARFLTSFEAARQRAGEAQSRIA